MTITTDLKLPTTCPCCGAGVKRETLDHETGGPTLTRVYGHADAQGCGATLSISRVHQDASEPPIVLTGCREALRGQLIESRVVAARAA